MYKNVVLDMRSYKVFFYLVFFSKNYRISFLEKLINAEHIFKMSTSNNMTNVFMEMNVTSDVVYGF